MGSLLTTFAGMQNLVLWQLKQRGVNFGGAPGNSAMDFSPPIVIAGLLNQGYSEFLSETLESGICVLKTSFLTVANATSYPLRPLPNTPIGQLNPAVLKVREGTYTEQVGLPNAGYERIFEIVSTPRFQALSGGYTRRLSWFGPQVVYACQEFGKPFLDVLPGTATAGDLINLTFIPDPLNSLPNVPASRGGMLFFPNDVPLFPPQFHMALVQYALMHAANASDQADMGKLAEERWNKYIEKAQEFGGTYGSGEAESVMIDKYAASDRTF